MAVIGVTLRVRDGRVRLRAVALDGPPAGAVSMVFEQRADGGAGPADQLRNVAGQFHRWLREVPEEVDALVVREVDESQRGGLTPARKLRARAEGAVLQVASAFTPRTEVMNGAQVARAAARGDLTEAETMAAALVPAQFVEAGAAAIAARSLR